MFHWGIDTNAENEELLDDVLNTSAPIGKVYTVEEREEIVSTKYSAAMDTMMRAHNNLVRLCYEQYERNSMRLMDP